ncbi:restriction endonuclease subunit S [Lactiplantibacillus plantarum]|uniref:restriction endonuclease subunit S n=1 Tax=Lactiplantibacillus plantarum TaxID=1590 RepID=UPI00247829E1|nr:restriction endonuclease subunit S [Lactiplantibacillus plantarum]
MKDNQTKYPQLRFKGFTDPWEQRKLGELFKPSRNKNNNDLYNQKDILAASLGTELIPKRTFFGLKSTKESVKNYRVVKHGDLIYTKSPIKGFPNGIVRTNKGNVGIVPSLYCVYQAQKEINTSIIQLYFEDKNRLDFYLFPLVNVGARNNVNITDLEFLEGIIKVPKSIEEQKKIVDFIEHFNKAITLHQRKLAKLKELKQGYLQKMFPKNGSKFPQLRFSGFADAWEERKFFESIASTIDFRGRTPKKLGMDWSESGYLALSALNVKNGYIDPLADAHYGDENLYKKWMSGKELKKGQVLFTTEAPMGNVAQVPDNNGYILSQRTVAFETKEDMMTNDFLAVLLKSPLVFNNLSALSSGGTAKGVSQKSLKGLSITVPFDIDEQQKIGSFFKQLDDIIALHQRKLEKLQELKKGYLQKMFC